MATPPRMLSCHGETLSISEWSQRQKIHVATIRTRLDRFGWSVEEAITTPPDARFDPRRPRRASVGIAEPPRVRRHRTSQSDRAYVRVSGKPLYLGKWGSAEAAAKYDRFLLEWRATGQANQTQLRSRIAGLRVVELAVEFLKYARGHYLKNGRITSEVSNYEICIKIMNRAYGNELAADFTPSRLEAVVAAMVERGFVRSSINRHRWRITNVWRFGVRRGLVDVAVWQALKSVPGLEAGRTTARDGQRITPVPEHDFAASLEYLAEPYNTIARLQKMLGMRPGEACAIEPDSLDRSEAEWVYDVGAAANKNLHRDKPQRYYLGPRAQALLLPWLDGKSPDQRLFVTRRGRPVSVKAYRDRIRAACATAGVPPWHPHQLRHNRATDVRRKYGSLRLATEALGHSDEATTLIYADANEPELRRLARETA